MTKSKANAPAVLVMFFLLSGTCFAASSQELQDGLSSLKNAGNSNEIKLADQLIEALQKYESVQDYEAFFEKTELDSSGKMGGTEKIYLKFEKPFKIFMGWLNAPKEGLQVVYERGQHDNKLAIHKPGLFFGLASVVFLDQNSPWIREGSASYNIEDAGIGTFLFDLSEAVIEAAKQKKLTVNFSNGEIHVTFMGSDKDSEFFAYRIETGFDEESRLPVVMRLYDWDNQLTGEYIYKELRLDVGMNENFKKQINRKLLKIYDRESKISHPTPTNFAKARSSG